MALTITPAEMLALLATVLAGATDEPAEHWQAKIGAVEKLPLAINVRCNWTIAPTGSKRELEAIGKAAEVVRAEYPYVVG